MSKAPGKPKLPNPLFGPEEFAEKTGVSRETLSRLKAYAEEMGVVFQITDDLLDVTSTAEKTGKAVGKDADMGKQTLVTLLGVDGARTEARRRAQKAVDALGPHAARAPELVALPFFLLDRDA